MSRYDIDFTCSAMDVMWSYGTRPYLCYRRPTKSDLSLLRWVEWSTDEYNIYRTCNWKVGV